MRNIKCVASKSQMFITALLAVFLCFVLTACGDSGDHLGEAKTPSGSSVQQGRNYIDVVEDFEEHGFTNVQTEGIDDLVFGWLTKEGEVEKVTIDGNEDYSPDKWVPADVEVIVYYHTFPQEGEIVDTDNGIVPPNEVVAPDPKTPPEEGQMAENENPSGEPGQGGSSIALPEESTFSIKFIDVGQADAALVECDGHYLLIDGGNKEDSSLIYSVLKKENVPHLDIIVGTHAHEDHIGGLPGAFNYTNADLTLCVTKSYDSDAFGDFKRYADQKGGGIVVPSVGDTYSLGSATINILGVNGGSDTNDTSIVLMITYGETKFLFTGDAEREAEQAILSSGASLSATVLKVGHHGSDTSTTYPFLREIMPTYAVISVGDGNSYGHPTDDTLSRLRDADVVVYRTDLQGDIVCTSDGKSVSFSVEKNTNADTLTAPDQQPTAPTIVPPSNTQDQPSEDETQGDEVQPGGSVGTDYVGNKNTKKFHYDWCSSVNKMKESNKFFYTGSREEMIGMGYDPCGNCHP